MRLERAWGKLWTPWGSQHCVHHGHSSAHSACACYEADRCVNVALIRIVVMFACAVHSLLQGSSEGQPCPAGWSSQPDDHSRQCSPRRQPGWRQHQCRGRSQSWQGEAGRLVGVGRGRVEEGRSCQTWLRPCRCSATGAEPAVESAHEHEAVSGGEEKCCCNDGCMSVSECRPCM